MQNVFFAPCDSCHPFGSSGPLDSSQACNSGNECGSFDVRMNNNILKTPLIIEAKSLTDTAGKKDVSNENQQVQLILQIISEKIVVTAVFKNYNDCPFTHDYDKLTIEVNPEKDPYIVITLENSEKMRRINHRERRLEISRFSLELLKAWFLSVTDRSWPCLPFQSITHHEERILFDFSQQEVPTLPETSNAAIACRGGRGGMGGRGGRGGRGGNEGPTPAPNMQLQVWRERRRERAREREREPEREYQ